MNQQSATAAPSFAAAAQNGSPVSVRALRETDLPEADRIFRLAFGTFIGLPEPMDFAAGCDFIEHRWRSAPHWTFGAELDGRLVGLNLATRWGSTAFFGPLAVQPEFWDRDFGQNLLAATMDLFDEWKPAHAALFTFPHSAKHAGLYQKFGFWPRFLTAIMARPVSAATPLPAECCFSKLSDADRIAAIEDCCALADELQPGLDLTHEIHSVQKHALGETILLRDGSRLQGFAVCHCGPGTEAGPETCYVKFGAVRSGAGAPRNFRRLLETCAALAAGRGLKRMLAGVNLECHRAYREMLAGGFRTEIQGVAMHRDNQPGYCREEVFVLSDLR